jgi:glycosyltransferase involved in cell wall biosynthesis
MLRVIHPRTPKSHRAGGDPLAIPNGLAAERLLPPPRQAVAAFRVRVRGRTVVGKVARWDPDKRWLLAVATLAAMKRQGWRPLPQPNIQGLLQTLEGLEGADLISVRSPLDSASCQVLFQGADAVLANSAHEPFGLVGLEAMAAGGVAVCVAASPAAHPAAPPGGHAHALA